MVAQLAKIPIYQQQVTPRAVDMPASARGARIMPTMGDGLQSIASGIDTIAQGVQAYDEGTFRLNQQKMAAFKEKTEDEARVWAAKATSEADLAMAEHLQKRQLAAPPGGSGFTPSFLKDYDEYVKKGEENAPSEYAKNLWRAHTARSREAYGRAALMWENQESQRYQGQQIDEGLQNSAKLVNSNPAWFEQEMGKWRSTIQSSTVNQETKAKLNEIARKTLVNASVVSWVDANPTQALTILRDIQKGGDPASDVTWQKNGAEFSVPVKLGTLEERLKWTEYAQRKVDDMRQDASVGLRYETQNMEAMARAGVAPTSPVRTREEFMAAFKDPQVAEHEYSRYTTARGTATATASLSGRPTSELLSVIQTKPDANDPQFAVKAANQQVQASAAAEIVKARLDDPVAYAQQTGDWKLQPLNPQDKVAFTEELKRRSAAMLGMQEKYGRAEMLSKPEATQLARTLEVLPADQKVAQLESIRQAVSDPTIYGRLLNSIRPDSPVTALVGNIAAVGAKDNARLIALGEDLLNPTKDGKRTDGKGAFPMPKESLLRQAWVDTIGNAYRGFPDAESTAYQAFKAYYAAVASQKGLNDPMASPDDKIVKDAVKAATGGVAKWKTHWMGNDTPSANIVLPYGVPESDLLDRATALWSQVRTDAGYPNTRVGDIGLQNTGENGKYLVMSGTSWLPDKSGRQIILDLSQPIKPAAPAAPAAPSAPGAPTTPATSSTGRPWYQMGPDITFKPADGMPPLFAPPSEWEAYRKRQQQNKGQ